MIDLCVGAHTYGGGAAHTGVKCTVHILCLYGDTVHLFMPKRARQTRAVVLKMVRCGAAAAAIAGGQAGVFVGDLFFVYECLGRVGIQHLLETQQ
jgi:hypothetical protein